MARNMFRKILANKVMSFLVLFFCAFIISFNMVMAAEGDTWILPSVSNIQTGQNFDIEVLIDTGGKDLGAFNMYFDFDPALIDIDITQGEDPDSDSGRGFNKGADTASYIMMSNSDDIANGHFRFAGIAAGSYANGSSEHLIIIHAKAKDTFTSGVTNLSLRVNELSDDLGNPITIGNITGGTATDTIAPVVTEYRSVATPTSDDTPDYVFTSTEAGSITYGGSCSSATTSAVAGDNTITFNTLTDGTYSDCTLTVTDSFGNESAVLNISAFTIDTTAPTVTEVTPVPVNTSDDTPSYTFSYGNNDGLGTPNWEGSCDGYFSETAGSVGAGNNTVTASAMPEGVYDNCTLTITDDNTGKASAINVSAFVIDTTAPVIAEVTPVETPTNDNTPNYVFSSTEEGLVTYGGSCSSVTTSAVAGDNTITFNTLTDGTYSDCTVSVTDAAGNVSSILGVTGFVVDTTAPVVTEVTPVPSSTNSNTPSYTFNTNEAGTITYGGSCSSATTSAVAGDNTITFNTLTDGTYSDCTITVTDSVNNISDVLAISEFTVDTTAPTITEITPVPNPTSDNTPDYTFNATEAGTITYGGDCSSATTNAVTGNNTVTFNTLTDGAHSNCTIVVVDAAGNVSTILNVAEFSIDTTAPTVTEVTPVATPTNDNTPDYTFNADEAGSITYGGGCSSTTTSAVVGDNPITFDTLADGVYSSCTITVTDAAGNASTALTVSTFTVDAAVPVVTEVTPVSTLTNDSTPDYTFNASEPSTITYGGDCSSTTTDAVTGDNTVTFNALGEGEHSNCTIMLTDLSGNNSDILTVSTFTIDTTAPIVTEVTPVSDPTNDSTPDYTFNATEAGTITYGGDCSSTITDATTGNNTVTFNALADGVHSNCTIVVTDVAGNGSAALSVTSFTVAVPPTRSNGAPEGNLPLGTTETTISLDTDENATCKYDTTAGIAYDAMVNTFSTTGGVAHSQLITGLTDGSSYVYYVKCEDVSGNDNLDDFIISFDVNTTCTDFTYSDWGSCQSNGIQTRTVVTSMPSGCTGGTPELERECTPVDEDDVNDFTPKVKLKGISKKVKLDRKKKVYVRRKKLSFNGKTEELAGGRVQLFVDGDEKDEDDIDSRGEWKVSRKIKKSGTHKIKFKYYDSSGNFIGESSSYKIKVDTKKPKFIDLPSFLNKRAGEKVSFEATDTKSKKLNPKKDNKIKYYKYYLDGKKHKTKKPYFYLPAGLPKGLHTLRVKAYDKAGNKAKKTVVIRVR